MPRYFHTNLIGPDISARVWFPSGQRQRIRKPIIGVRSFLFNLSPVISQAPGKLQPHAVLVLPGESVKANIWLGLPDAVRQLLHLGFQFGILPLHVVDDPKNVRSVGYGVVTEVLEPITYFYAVDAIVLVALRAEYASPVLGRLLEFEFPRLGKRWKGHLGDNGGDASGGGSLGDRLSCHLCLHDLILSPQNPSPGGQPFVQDDVFTIWAADVPVGSGVVIQLPVWGQRLLMREPVLGI